MVNIGIKTMEIDLRMLTAILMVKKNWKENVEINERSLTKIWVIQILNKKCENLWNTIREIIENKWVVI